MTGSPAPLAEGPLGVLLRQRASVSPQRLLQGAICLEVVDRNTRVGDGAQQRPAAPITERRNLPMTMTTDATDARPEAHVSPIYVHVDDPGLLAIDGPDCRAYVTLNAGRSITLFFDDPLALAVRLRDLAADLEAYAQVDAA